jgi:hypothetical protein
MNLSLRFHIVNEKTDEVLHTSDEIIKAADSLAFFNRMFGYRDEIPSAVIVDTKTGATL